MQKIKKKKKIDENNKVLKFAVELFHATENYLVYYFKKVIFSFKGDVFNTKKERSEEIKEEQKKNSLIMSLL